jgi:hypothetical protein
MIDSAMTDRVRLGEIFTYSGFSVDSEAGRLRCTYRLGPLDFVETVQLGPGLAWSAGAQQAARLVYLPAGVSYYKMAAPPVVDLACTPVLPGELDFLQSFFVNGLGEFALKNGLDLSEVAFVGGAEMPDHRAEPQHRSGMLVPFGGGLDSVVTVELVRNKLPTPALFVVNPPGDRFAAIERAAAVTGLPILRAERSLDPKVLAPAEGVLRGHVPVTGIISAVAVLAALLDGRSQVVMSNEQSASSGNVETDHGVVNHQWSKSAEFERLFSQVVSNAVGPGFECFSLLRPYSELWIARRFASARPYHGVFRSCNRAFHLDPRQRLDDWCGICDKCCFIDLVLAPFLSAQELAVVFSGQEPLRDKSLVDRFRTLVGVSPDAKPWECVGDVEECQAAAVLAFERPDRRGDPVLTMLVQELGSVRDSARRSAIRLLSLPVPYPDADAVQPTGSLV